MNPQQPPVPGGPNPPQPPGSLPGPQGPAPGPAPPQPAQPQPAPVNPAQPAAPQPPAPPTPSPQPAPAPQPVGPTPNPANQAFQPSTPPGPSPVQSPSPQPTPAGPAPQPSAPGPAPQPQMNPAQPIQPLPQTPIATAPTGGSKLGQNKKFFIFGGVLALIFGGLIILALILGDGFSAARDLTTFTDEDGDYSLEVPATWMQDGTSSARVFTSDGVQADDTDILISVNSIPSISSSQAEDVDALLAQLEESTKTGIIADGVSEDAITSNVIETDATPLGKALVISYESEVSENDITRTIRFDQILLIQEGEQGILVSTAVKIDDYASLQGTVDRILSSAKLL